MILKCHSFLYLQKIFQICMHFVYRFKWIIKKSVFFFSPSSLPPVIISSYHLKFQWKLMTVDTFSICLRQILAIWLLFIISNRKFTIRKISYIFIEVSRNTWLEGEGLKVEPQNFISFNFYVYSYYFFTQSIRLEIHYIILEFFFPTEWKILNENENFARI